MGNYLQVSSVATKRLLKVIGENNEVFCENCEITVITPICSIYSQLLSVQARLSEELEKIQNVVDKSTAESFTTNLPINPLEKDSLCYFKPFRSSLTAKCQLKRQELLPFITPETLIKTSETLESDAEVDDDDNGHVSEPLDSSHLSKCENTGEEDETNVQEYLINIELPDEIKTETEEEVNDSAFYLDSQLTSDPQPSRKALPSPLKVKRHMKSSHDIPPIRCSFCNTSYSSESGLHYHINTVHKPKTLLCSHCPVMFSHQQNLQRHFVSKHSATLSSTPLPTRQDGEPLNCPTCGKLFPTPEKVSIHIKNVHSKKHHQTNQVRNPKTEICQLCGKMLATEKSLQQHVARFHPTEVQTESWAKCPSCDEPFYKKYLLEHHLRSCQGKKRDETQNAAELQRRDYGNLAQTPLHLRCDLCNRTFSNTAMKSQHVAQHSSQNFPCTDCGVTYRWASGLAKHRRNQHKQMT
ncbi:putative zinc finger protein [Orchesella cincta]|uniref:Putative zinc finger protein n=1 Tax=Orchesella cincta TaxID=48709 RepID=A0A1D2MKB3_ORCCI|nr:putative zinc finger protein [Orchesella cincta]